MEPNNIDQLIKQHLKDKEVVPSIQAREKLIELIDTSKQSNRNKLWFRLSIAASLIIGLFIFKEYVFNQTTIINPKVDSQDVIIVDQQPKPTIDKELTPKNNDNQNKENINKTEKTSITRNKVKSSKQSQIAYSKTETNQNETIKTKTDNNIVLNGLEYVKIDEDTLSIKPKTDTKNTSINTYITPNALLASLDDNQNTTIEDTLKLKPTNSNYVNSDRLLLNTEKQLFFDESKGTLQKISKHYKSIKTAVVNRNNN